MFKQVAPVALILNWTVFYLIKSSSKKNQEQTKKKKERVLHREELTRTQALAFGYVGYEIRLNNHIVKKVMKQKKNCKFIIKARSK